MTGVDLQRTVPLRVVDALPPRDPAPFGEATAYNDGSGEPAGFMFGCPGCGAQLSLPINPRPGRIAWTVTAGDARTGAGLTLSPSVHHVAPQGCGWHGFLTNGVFAPC